MKKILFFIFYMFFFVSSLFASGVWRTTIASDVIVDSSTFTGVLSGSTDVQDSLELLDFYTPSTTTLAGYAKLNATQTFTGSNTFNNPITVNATSYFENDLTCNASGYFTGILSASNLSGTNTGDVTLDVVGSTPTAEGAILTGQVLQLQPADQTNPGLMTTAYQKFSGNKQFDGIIYATNINATTGAGLSIKDYLNNPIMKIDGTGSLNVGIGLTNPSEKLEVNGNIKADNIIASTGTFNYITISTQNVIYVGKNGADAPQNGSIVNPFQTIQYAINSISPTSGNRYAIKVAPGNYPEIITLKPYIDIEGSGLSPTTIVVNSASDVITAPTSMNYGQADLRNLVITNSGSGKGLVLQDKANVGLRGISLSTLGGITIETAGESFLIVDDCGLGSANNTCVNIQGTTFAYIYNGCSFYSEPTTHYDLVSGAGTIVSYSVDTDFIDKTLNLLGTVNLISRAEHLFYDNTSSGLTATNTNDAIDEVNSITLKKDGSVALTADWNAGNFAIQAATGIFNFINVSTITISSMTSDTAYFNEIWVSTINPNSPLVINNTTNDVLIIGSGNVGIGLTNPTADLHIYGSDGNSGLNLERTDNTKETGMRFKSDGLNSWFFGIDQGGDTGNALELYGYDIADYAMVVSTHGRIGLGLSNPTQKLEVVGIIKSSGVYARGSDGLKLYDDSGSLGMNIIDGGNVGIGIANPTRKLHIFDDTNQPRIEVKTNNAGFNAYMMLNSPRESVLEYQRSNGRRWLSYVAQDDNYYLQHSNTEKYLLLDYISEDFCIDPFNVIGQVGIGMTNPTSKLHVIGDGYFSSDLQSATTVQAVVGNFDEVYSDTGTFTNIYVSTINPNSPLYINNGANNVLFTGSGSIGIGTTDPLVDLHVYGSDGHGNINIERTDNSREAAIRFRSDGAYKWLLGIDEAGGAGSALEIYKYEAPAGFVVVISTSGNVGIGTVNPTEKLHVIGDIQSSTTMYAPNADFDIIYTSTINPTSPLYITDNIIVGTGGAGVDYQITFDGEDNDGSISWDEDNAVLLLSKMRGSESNWYYCKYMDGINLAPAASGATEVAPSASTLGGYQLDAATEYLYFNGLVCSNWDNLSDVEIIVFFECNVDNTGGNVTDTVDLQVISWFKGLAEVTNKTQTVEVANTVGQSPRYKLFVSTFLIDYDDGTNPVDIGDDMSFRLNLETDTSEVDNVVITFVIFRFKTKKIQIEV